VKPSYGLTDEEVMRMLTESFEQAEADFEVRLLIEARNEAESVVVATEKSLRRPDFEELAKELPKGEPARIESSLARLKEAIGGTDRARIQDETHALNHATQKLAELVMNRSVREALAGKNVEDV
jgi:molecular chaperone HscA